MLLPERGSADVEFEDKNYISKTTGKFRTEGRVNFHANLNWGANGVCMA
jgi:hypothetical protein